MRVVVDAELCTACGLCADICPEVFELEDDYAVVKEDPVPASCLITAQEAADGCPVEAISIE